MVKAGKAKELVPKEIWWQYLSAERLLSLYTPDSIEEIFSYAQPDKNRYVSVSGIAYIVRDQRKNQELWNPIYKTWFPKGLDDPELALLRIAVQSAEYWDGPSSTLVQITGFVKALATGQPYDGGTNERMKLAQG